VRLCPGLGELAFDYNSSRKGAAHGAMRLSKKRPHGPGVRGEWTQSVVRIKHLFCAESANVPIVCRDGSRASTHSRSGACRPRLNPVLPSHSVLFCILLRTEVIRSAQKDEGLRPRPERQKQQERLADDQASLLNCLEVKNEGLRHAICYAFRRPPRRNSFVKKLTKLTASGLHNRGSMIVL
jgi:hypothetical protein